jgi:phosphohistidine phosphatase SixA/8-oxo-dGTP pyrophosphatase MutT (NUDIX family)
VAALVTRQVLAAGGVIWRATDDRADPEILVVHRPRYDDWSLPKGKLDPGEHRLAAAVREVYEESGARGAPQVRLRTVSYLTSEPGVEKSVEYWAMRCLADDGHNPDDEVDVRQWVPLRSARERLTYAHDRGVVATFAALPPLRGVVVLIRHAYAGKRENWDGPDEERPLDDTGRRDAEHAAPLLALFAPERVISAPALRCRQTVAPAARALGTALELDGRFAENGDPDEAIHALRALAAANRATVVCSQGGLIRPLLTKLRGAGGEPSTPKGTAWVLAFGEDGALASTDPLDPRAEAS